MEPQIYQMPVLTEKERNELIERYTGRIHAMKSWLKVHPTDDEAPRDILAHQIALAALTAKPAAVVEMTHGNGWNPPEPHLSICDIRGMQPGDRQDLYVTPPVPALKPVVMNNGVLKSDGGIWYTDKRVAQILRDAGYEVDL